MPDLRIAWTALPRAATAQHLDVDVFVSPRLGVDAPPGAMFTLADFPLFEHWPTQVDDHLTFEIELEGVPAPVSATRVPLAANQSAVDLDLPTWQRLFPTTTPVEPWTRRDPSGRPLFSYPADAVSDYLSRTYRDAGRTSPLEPTDEQGLGGLVGDAGDLVDTRIDQERPEPTSHTNGGETIGGGPAPTVTQPGCLKGCLTAPLEWLVWFLRWLWHLVAGGPPPKPITVQGPAPPPISVTPKVVTYEFPEPTPRPVPPAIAAVEQHVADNGVTPPAGWTPAGGTPGTDAIAIASAWRFFHRPESPAAGAAPPAPEDWDVHRRLGALGDYPLLLRRLGIVVRLRVPRPAGQPAWVRVVPIWDGAPDPARDLTPRTHCHLDGNRFTAQPATGSELADGGLDLTGASDGATNTRFRLMVVDTDGAVLKAVHTAASLVRYQALRARGLVQAGTRAEGLPALRSAGVAVVRTSRAQAIKDQLEHLASVAPRGGTDLPAELFADDLVRGFQVEVQDTGDPAHAWRSLCARRGTYYLLDDAGGVIDRFDLSDYGYVKRSSAASADAGESALYVHEAIVRWLGWSLVAPRPGRRIKSSPGPPQSELPVPPAPEPIAQLHLATMLHPVHGTLPKLRFGRSYRFRLPWVDLAGNGGQRAQHAPPSEAVMFRRFEPLAPPTLLPLNPYTPGESLEHLVIRSDINRNAGHYANEVLQPADATVTYHATVTRHVFPAEVAQHMAEQHGMLDGRPLAESWRASLRADNTFDVHSLHDLGNPAITIPFGTPGSHQNVASKADPADPEPVKRYATNSFNGPLPTPYLPDPIAAAVALRGVPRAAPGGTVAVHSLPAAAGSPAPVCHIPFDGTWPEVRSFRLRVAERPSTLDPATGIETFVHADDPPHWDAAARRLTIFLAKGEVASVPFSTVPESSGVDSLGAVDWLRRDPTPDAATENALNRAIELGCHWMVSPARTMTLVHAVQRPLAPAALTSVDPANKALGATVATIAGEMDLHAATTGHVTLLAQWTDEIDDGVSLALVKHEGSAALQTFDVPLPAGGPAFPPGGIAAAQHEFGDTKHRIVRYRLRASTRFREYFPAQLAGQPAADGSDGFSRVGAELSVSVLNSAAPDLPSLRYVMPSFGWDAADPPSPTNWTNFARTRIGGGVRVFLDRPWRTSGPGEQLGVVVTSPGHATPSLVSELGVDPTWPSAATPDMTLATSAFTGGDTYVDVPLNGGETGAIVGYDPVLDHDRKQWYADVSIDMATLDPAYWPFIRLALVRFQPESVDLAKASKTILSEFTQLAPDRKLDITVAGANVNVTVRGRGPALPHPFVTNLMLIALEESDDADPDELGWRPVGSTSGPSVGDAFEARLADCVTGTADGDGFRWERTLTMPGPRGDRVLRVVVRELELRGADDETAQDRFASIQPVGEVAISIVRQRLLPRVVYADSVRLA